MSYSRSSARSDLKEFTSPMAAYNFRMRAICDVSDIRTSLVSDGTAVGRFLGAEKRRPSLAGDSRRWSGKLDHSWLAERLADARRDSRTAVREHKRPKDRRTVPRDEHAKASIEKGLADRLNIGEVQTHAAGGFQRSGDLVVDLLRVNTCTHPRAVVAHPNNLHRTSRYRVAFVASPCAASSGQRPVSASA